MEGRTLQCSFNLSTRRGRRVSKPQAFQVLPTLSTICKGTPPKKISHVKFSLFYRNKMNKILFLDASWWFEYWIPMNGRTYGDTKEPRSIFFVYHNYRYLTFNFEQFVAREHFCLFVPDIGNPYHHCSHCNGYQPYYFHYRCHLCHFDHLSN